MARRSALIALTAALIWAVGATAQEQAQGVDITVEPGVGFTRTVATFTWGIDAEFNATILWGDGTSRSAGDVVVTGGPNPDGLYTYEVRGSHTYAAAGSYALSTTISRTGATPVQVNSAATVTGATPPPPPPAPPPPPTATAPRALLTVTPPATPGGIAFIDASASTGAITGYQFDLDGNGSYETKCAGPGAQAVFGKDGSHTVGVKVVGLGGSSSTSSSVTTARALPRIAQVSLGAPQGVAVMGACLDQLVGAQKSVHECPGTLKIGRAELAIPPGSGKACFERQPKPSAKPSLKQPVRFLANTGQVVLVNGVRLEPEKDKGVRIMARPSPAEILTTVDGKLAGQARVRLLGKGTDIAGDYKQVVWQLSSPGLKKPSLTVDTVGGIEGTLHRLPVASGGSPLTLLDGGRSRLRVQLSLPSPFDVLAGQLLTSSDVTLEADNTDGLIVKSLKIGFAQFDLSLFSIRKLELAYESAQAGDVWTGSFDLGVPAQGGIAGSLTIVNGNLAGASVKYDFGTGVGQIGCCAYLKQISAALSGDAFSGGAVFTAGPSYGNTAAARVDTNVTVFFSPRQAAFHVPGFDPVVTDASVVAEGGLSVVGLHLFDAVVLVGPGGFFAGGNLDAEWSIFKVAAGLRGQVNSPTNWVLGARGEVCVDLDKWRCLSGKGVLGPNGLAACIKVKLKYLPDPAGGGYVRWSNWKVGFFWGCSWAKLDDKAGVARASGPFTVRMPAGLPHTLVRVRGRGDVPNVELTDPRGRHFTAPDGGEGEDPRGLFWVRDEGDRAVYVMLGRPAAGRWRVRALPGSPPIATVGRADPVPRRVVRARVGGAGRRRVVRYRVAPVAGQRITFYEQGKGVSRVLGRARTGSGALRFSPADGPAGRRRIEALVERDGMPVEQVTVARFRSPGPLLPGRPKVGLRRSQSDVLLTLGRASGARSYRAVVTSSDGGRRLLVTRRRRLLVRGVGVRSGIRVSVAGVSATSRAGPTAQARLAALPPVTAPRAVSLGSLLGRGLAIRCAALADGRCQVRAIAGARTVGRASRGMLWGESVPLRLRIARAQRARLTRVSSLRLRVTLPGEAERELRVRLRPR